MKKRRLLFLIIGVVILAAVGVVVFTGSSADSDEALPRVDHLVEGGPRLPHRLNMQIRVESDAGESRHQLIDVHVAFEDDAHDFVGMGVEKSLDVLQRVGEAVGAQRTVAMAQVDIRWLEPNDITVLHEIRGGEIACRKKIVPFA